LLHPSHAAVCSPGFDAAVFGGKIAAVSEPALAEALRNLPRIGQLVKDRGYRQVWRFAFGERAYFLKFYPQDARPLVKRLFAQNPAFREFTRLIALQKASIPSPRAVAVLRGFRIDGRRGDAVILHAIEPSIQLDRYLNDCDLAGVPVPDRHRLAQSLIDLVHRLGQNKLGHNDLHLGNLLLSEGKLYLLDGYAVQNGGLTLRHVMMLGHAVGRWATRGEIIRGWRRLTATDSTPPERNSISPKLNRRFLRRTRGDNPYFGRFDADGWRGYFRKGLKLPRWWAPASALRISAEDWAAQWPALLRRLDERAHGPEDILKRTRSGDVLAETVRIGGQCVDVVVKRPQRKSTWKQINSVFRPGKARRSWFKAWKLAIRGFPAEWPLLLMERKVLGYTIDSVLVVARVHGPTLAECDLDSFDAGDRETLFRRVGRTLRRLERAGFSHFDAKSSNWIVLSDPQRGPVPVMIDVDGIRSSNRVTVGVERILRSMKEHAQYTPLDSLHLCKGYAPFAPLLPEDPP
jgi:tRNA A-37 threonylcarbamoyl transferase component Bud32